MFDKGVELVLAINFSALNAMYEINLDFTYIYITYVIILSFIGKLNGDKNRVKRLKRLNSIRVIPAGRGLIVKSELNAYTTIILLF